MGVPGQDLYKPAAFPITQPTVVNGGKKNNKLHILLDSGQELKTDNLSENRRRKKQETE